VLRSVEGRVARTIAYRDKKVVRWYAFVPFFVRHDEVP
jgi:hypothetical protein